jgi:hypothetical protein
MSSVALAPPLLLLLEAPLRTDGAAEDANLPASTRFRFTLQGSAALPKLLPGRFRCGIASFSLSRVRSFFCSCAMEIKIIFRLIIQNSCELFFRIFSQVPNDTIAVMFVYPESPPLLFLPDPGLLVLLQDGNQASLQNGKKPDQIRQLQRPLLNHVGTSSIGTGKVAYPVVQERLLSFALPCECSTDQVVNNGCRFTNNELV